jgi:hypothetical protein
MTSVKEYKLEKEFPQEKFERLKMAKEERARVEFMRWVSSLSKNPWLPRRPRAMDLWDDIKVLVSKFDHGISNKEV